MRSVDAAACSIRCEACEHPWMPRRSRKEVGIAVSFSKFGFTHRETATMRTDGRHVYRPIVKRSWASRTSTISTRCSRSSSACWRSAVAGRRWCAGCSQSRDMRVHNTAARTRSSSSAGVLHHCGLQGRWAVVGRAARADDAGVLACTVDVCGWPLLAAALRPPRGHEGADENRS